jgi:hypothetical protein
MAWHCLVWVGNCSTGVEETLRGGEGREASHLPHISPSSPLSHLSLLSAPEEKKAAGGGGGPVRLRSTSRKDSISEDEMVLRERSYDYQFRYCGHCNTTTDIKEANFFGRSEALSRRRAHIPVDSRV